MSLSFNERKIKAKIDSFTIAEKIRDVGIVTNYNGEWTGAHDYLVKEIAEKGSMNEVIKELNGYPIDLILLMLSMLSMPNDLRPENIKSVVVRPNGIIEMWSLAKLIAEKTDLEKMKKSEMVQAFIKDGYKDAYVGVTKEDFDAFSNRYKKGWFGGGRKSRKQNKSRKQGKSKKQRKTRK